MSRTLIFARKLLSLKNRILVTEASGAQIYEASWSIGIPTRIWEISDGTGSVVASFRRQVLALRPTWAVKTPAGAYTLRKPWFSVLRRMLVVGGPFDGAVMTSGPFRMNYKIELGPRLIARADTKILTLRDRHDVELVDETTAAQQLAVVLVVNLMVEEFARKDSAATGTTRDD